MEILLLISIIIFAIIWFILSRGVQDDQMKNARMIEWPDGSKSWHLGNWLHREDGPAQEWVDGTKTWYLFGKRHRVDGPAVEWSNGDKIWYVDGERHREDGPAEILADGTKTWYLNGMKVPSF